MFDLKQSQISGSMLNMQQRPVAVR